MDLEDVSLFEVTTAISLGGFHWFSGGLISPLELAYHLYT